MAKKGKRKTKGKGGKSSGVSLDEVSSGSRPIEGVGTSTAAFVGFVPKGPGVLWRRTGALLVLVTGAAAGIWAWRQRAGDLDRR